MIVKIKKLHATRQALMSLANQPVKAKTAYVISKDLGLIQSALKNYDTAIDGLIKQYGVKPENGSNPYIDLSLLPPETVKDIQSQIDELLEVEEDVDFRMIPGNEISNLDITPGGIEALGFLITIPEDWN